MVKSNKTHPLPTLKRKETCNTVRWKQWFCVSVSLFSVGQTPPFHRHLYLQVPLGGYPVSPEPQQGDDVVLVRQQLRSGSWFILRAVQPHWGGRRNPSELRRKRAKFNSYWFPHIAGELLSSLVVSAKNRWKLWISYFIDMLSILYTLFRVIFYNSSEVTIQLYFDYILYYKIYILIIFYTIF